ncbi:putative patatin/cPLA2 family phospholipase [Bacillus capparidis]|uniref:Patatin/cPLA2 family phospholipase n=1 Tax=Bacillus capparidis TaxID=1840411 RepID=A0ABS4CYI4_9BACI|nr:putative patatin/cPLA2 family phospholipase [Bacillus capparidis]
MERKYLTEWLTNSRLFFIVNYMVKQSSHNLDWIFHATSDRIITVGI